MKAMFARYRWLSGAVITTVGFVALVVAAQAIDSDSGVAALLFVGAIVVSGLGSGIAATKAPSREVTNGILAVLVPSTVLQVFGVVRDAVIGDSSEFASRLAFVMATTLTALAVATCVAMVRTIRARRLPAEP